MQKRKLMWGTSIGWSPIHLPDKFYKIKKYKKYENIKKHKVDIITKKLTWTLNNENEIPSQK